MQTERANSESHQDADHASSRGSAFFLNEKARAEMLGWILNALGSKRFARRVGDNHAAEVVEHAWIFQFIDIIYVATIFKLSHLISACGQGDDVYVLCFAYFAIMFSTRSAFDVYTCVSGASGVLHLIACCFYGMGVFIMTVNISAKSSEGTGAAHASMFDLLDASDLEQRSLLSNDGNVSFGSCSRSIDYDMGFASAFIFTRVVLVVMYGLYFFIFHESNILGHAPDMGSVSKDLRLSDLTRESDMEAAMRVGPPASTPGGVGASTTGRTTSVMSTDSHSHTSSRLADVDNPLTRLTTVRRPTYVMQAANAFRESVVQKHFFRIFLLKVLPVTLSSLVISALYFGASPVVVLPVVAGIEFVGDFLPSYFIRDPADWRELNPHRHFSEERLGLFFMLVLGEAVLGLCTTNYTSPSMSKVYRVLL